MKTKIPMKRPTSLVKLSRKPIRAGAKPRLMRRSEQVFVALRHLQVVDDLLSVATDFDGVDEGCSKQVVAAVNALRAEIFNLTANLLCFERIADYKGCKYPPEFVVDPSVTRGL